jgi:hypothetical protein
MKTWIRILLNALLLPAAIALYACHPQPTRTWILLTALNTEPPGYPSYTYVFFGNENGKLRPDLKSRQQDRNRALLDAITAQASSESAPATVFCIPAKAGGPQAQADAGNYSSELADSYRSMLAVGFPGSHIGRLSAMRFITDPGPFLVTTLTPPHLGKSGGPILYTELSRVDPKQIRNGVAAYREPAEESGSGGQATDRLLQHMEARLKKAHFDTTVWTKN